MLTPEMNALRDWTMECASRINSIRVPEGVEGEELLAIEMIRSAREGDFMAMIQEIDRMDLQAVENRRVRNEGIFHQTLEDAQRISQEAQLA